MANTVSTSATTREAQVVVSDDRVSYPPVTVSDSAARYTVTGHQPTPREQ